MNKSLFVICLLFSSPSLAVASEPILLTGSETDLSIETDFKLQVDVEIKANDYQVEAHEKGSLYRINTETADLTYNFTMNSSEIEMSFVCTMDLVKRSTQESQLKILKREDGSLLYMDNTIARGALYPLDYLLTRTHECLAKTSNNLRLIIKDDYSKRVANIFKQHPLNVSGTIKTFHWNKLYRINALPWHNSKSGSSITGDFTIHNLFDYKQDAIIKSLDFVGFHDNDDKIWVYRLNNFFTENEFVIDEKFGWDRAHFNSKLYFYRDTFPTRNATQEAWFEARAPLTQLTEFKKDFLQEGYVLKATAKNTLEGEAKIYLMNSFYIDGPVVLNNLYGGSHYNYDLQLLSTNNLFKATFKINPYHPNNSMFTTKNNTINTINALVDTVEVKLPSGKSISSDKVMYFSFGGYDGSFELPEFFVLSLPESKEKIHSLDCKTGENVRYSNYRDPKCQTNKQDKLSGEVLVKNIGGIYYIVGVNKKN